MATNDTQHRHTVSSQKKLQNPVKSMKLLNRPQAVLPCYRQQTNLWNKAKSLIFCNFAPIQQSSTLSMDRTAQRTCWTSWKKTC